MNRPRRLWAYLRLARPPNLLIVGLSIAVGSVVSRPDSLEAAFVAVAAGVLVAGGGNALNDYYDRDIDGVNRPNRPIPSALATPRGAVLLSSGLLLAGWLLSLRVGAAPFVLVTSWVALLTLYSAKLKRRGIAGNLLVSAVSASAFLLGGLTARAPVLSLVPAGLAFLFHLGREILKDVEDMEGDRRVGVRSLAIVYGRDRALAAAAGVFALLVAVTPLPFLAGVYNLAYLAAVVVGVDLPLLYVIRTALGVPSEERLQRLSALLKADMVIGIGSILVGSGAVL